MIFSFCEVQHWTFLRDYILQIYLSDTGLTVNYDTGIYDAEIRLRNQQWTMQWPQHYTKCCRHSHWLACHRLPGYSRQLFQHLKFALTNLHNVRAIGVWEAFRTLAWVKVIIQPWQTDATIFAWVGVTRIPYGVKEKERLLYKTLKKVIHSYKYGKWLITKNRKEWRALCLLDTFWLIPFCIYLTANLCVIIFP